MEIKYTESGEKELKAFLDHQKSSLETQIKNDKYVFGDDVIEIVARDIKEAGEQIKLSPRNRRSKYASMSMLLKLYFVAGIMLALFGIFREQIMYILDTNRMSLIYIVAGGGLSLFSWLMGYYIKQRDERMKHFEDEHNKINANK
jgi:hypothetical protein